MYLIIKLSKNVTSISSKSIADFINSVYTNVYDYDAIDIKELKVRDL